jgi:hypothetical protein
MTFSNINVSSPNDGLGDKLRNAFIIVNENFSQIQDQVSLGQLNTILGSYSTIQYVDTQDTNLQNQITSLSYSLDLSEGSIQTLQTDLNNLELLVGGKASISQLNNSVSAINSTISNIQVEINNKIDDAPANGKTYGRKDETWQEVTGGSSTYKVYSAIVNQSGDGTSEENGSGDGDLVIGRTYQIINTDSDSCDFTNVGALNNNLNTWFVATGTTPTSWGVDNKAKLGTIQGAPVVNVLENTIGDIVWFYDGVGYYQGFIFDNTNTAIPTFFEAKTPILNYTIGLVDYNQFRYLTISRGNDDWIRFSQFDSGLSLQNEIVNGFIEIRVYN